MKRRSALARLSIFAPGLVFGGIALAQERVEDCYRVHEHDAQARLSCYDALARPRVVAAAEPGARTDAGSAVGPASGGTGPGSATTPPDAASGDSPIDREWMQFPGGGRPQIHAHRPSYFIWRWTDRINQVPSSPASGHAVTASQQWQPGELKFQLSAKGDVYNSDPMEGILKRVRVWLAFTQQSNWQALNGQRSSPFRESNYEPEIITTFALKDAGPLRLVNVGAVHQSNGRSLPESRSWNRFYVQGGFDINKDWSFQPKVWMRLHESDDDNPDITRNYGRGEMLLRGELAGGDRVRVLYRSNLALSPSRGFWQVDYVLPERKGDRILTLGPTRWYLQLTSGYGESLIDYNFRQNTVGVGMAYGM